MVNIKTFEGGSDLQLIHAYGEGGFRVTGTRYEGDVLVLPRLTQSWRCPELDGLRFAAIGDLLGSTPPPLLLLGTGGAPQTQYPDFATDLKARGISLEVMSTPAACRTWNVLMSEGRNAAALLVAV